MQPIEPVINYLVDPNSVLKQVITEFLNAVMLLRRICRAVRIPVSAALEKAHRNGTRSRTLKTRVGELTLDKPQFRECPFESNVLKDTVV